ncbi:ribonuclease H-like domain-containing protein [Tanacetum coccineum]
MSGSQDEIPPPPPPPSSSQTPTQQTPHTVSTIKLPILKKREYDIWAMKMKHYLAHTDDPIWEVIQNGNGPVSITTDTQGQIKKSKKMQKYILKQQFEGISTEDANKKFLRSLPSAWSQVSLIMRTKPGVDSISFDDLYNNLRVFENDVKGSTASSSNTQNVAFVSENTSSMNDVSTAYGRKLQFDAKEPVGFDKTKVECYSCHKTGHFARECRTKGNQDSRRRDAWNSGNKDGRRSGKQEDSKALVTIDGEGVDWTSHSKEEKDYALMACNSSGSDTEAYTQALKKVEAQLVAHQQGQLWYEEKIRFMKIDLDDKTDVLTYHKKLLAEAKKEKEDLKAKVEKWHNSSKNLGKLLNTQMSANDKFGLSYRDYRYDGILSYENEVLQSVFMNKESDLENQPLYDRFVTAEGMHAVPPPMIGNYMPSGPDIEIDYSQFTYGPKQSQPSESETQTSDFDTCESNISVETSEFVTETVVNEPKVVSQPKVWSDAPIIEEYELDSEDDHVSLPTEEHETPSFANQQVKTPRKTVKNQFTHSKNPKVDKKGLGYGFVTKAGFVYGSLSHLIKDCDFHEKRMAKQVELNKKKGKDNVQRENKLVWNNVQRVNHKNQFVPRAVLTRTGKLSISAVGGKRETAVKPSAGCNWRPKRHYWHKVSKYNGGSSPRNCATFKDPLGRPKSKKAWAHDWKQGDLFHLYDLVMEQYSEITLEGIELILWGDLKIMMESSTKENDQSDFWNDQQDWEIVTWRLYEACGVYILELKDGTVIHMLVERRYPLSKDLLQRMLDLGLEVERESTAALDLIRFIKQQIGEE